MGICLQRRKTGGAWVLRWEDAEKRYRGYVFATVADCPTKEDAKREAIRLGLHEKYVIPARQARLNKRRSGLPKKPEFVYLIRCGEYCKIGKSNDPVRRLVDLQIATPHECELVFHIQSANSYRLEALAHRAFKDKHHRGEWFRITGEAIAEVIALLQSSEQSMTVKV